MEHLFGERPESWVDRQIRLATERGEFDDLPGLGKPLPDNGETYDENWWLKGLIKRENLTGLAPTTLKLRKEVEELPATLAGKSSEAAVREIIADLNRRIVRVQRGLEDGPPIVIEKLDTEAIIATWRRSRDV